MYILGISCFYHESSACLIYNGKVIAASAEERFSRKKHDSEFPNEAIKFCLKQANITVKDLAHIVFYEKPFWKFQRLLFSTLATYPLSARLFTKGMVNFLTDKLWVRSYISEKLKVNPQRILFVPHHISHAASAFYPSGFNRSAILTIDGVGEWTTTTLGVGDEEKIKIISEIRFPHSIGLLYSAFTAFLGFEVNDGEYKVMGMAPYGTPKYINMIRKLVDVYPDSSFKLKMEYFSFHKSASVSYSKQFEKLFGKPRPIDTHFFTKKSGFPSYFGQKPRNYIKLEKQNQHYADIASSIQKFTEERILALANNLYKETGLNNLCIAGGVGLNSVANGILLRDGPFKRIFVQPAAGDDGGSMGAALFAYHSILNKKRKLVQEDCFFGIEYKNHEIEKFLRGKKLKYKKILNENKLIDEISDALVEGKVIGFFHGRAEWGPRALGARSILASPLKASMKDTINTKIKFREPYRPFAASVLEEKVSEYFDVGKLNHKYLSRFMMGVFPVVKSARKKIPAVIHVDNTCRIQIVNKKINPRFYNIIKSFGKKTNVYVLTNTSFNLKGEPIVNSPEDAFKTFINSGLDILVLENYLILKEDIV